jgi:hypothetical protein
MDDLHLLWMAKNLNKKRVLKRASTLSACRLLSIDPWFSPRWKINWHSASINTVWKLKYYLWMCSQGLFINCRWKLKGGAVSPCVHFTWYIHHSIVGISMHHMHSYQIHRLNSWIYTSTHIHGQCTQMWAYTYYGMVKHQPIMFSKASGAPILASQVTNPT